MLSIIPYISTRWENVQHLFLKDNILTVFLKDGASISIAGLEEDELNEVFTAHFLFEQQATSPHDSKETTSKGSLLDQLFTGNTSFKFSVGNSSDLLGQALQHNPAHAELPSLPQEVATKISSLSKIISPEEILSLPLAEENCNCLYCQINRILRKDILQNPEFPDHPIFNEIYDNVTEEDLRFEQWEIKTIANNMYAVTNKLDSNEQYNVHLGKPIGCTCGRDHCAHIEAVLRTSA